MVVDDNINSELSKRKPVYTGKLKLGHMEPYSLQEKEHMGERQTQDQYILDRKKIVHRWGCTTQTTVSPYLDF